MSEPQSASTLEAARDNLPARLGAMRRAAGWFLRAKELRAARSASQAITTEQKLALSRARLCRELADRVLQAVDPLANGSGMPLALELHRQGFYWALLSGEPVRTVRPSLQDLWGRASEESGGFGLPEADLHELDRLVSAEPPFVVYAELTEHQQRCAIEQTGPFLDRLIEVYDARSLTLRRLLIQRALRIALLFVVVTGVLLVAVPPLFREPDLAEGKSWSASSALFSCHPEKKDCGGAHTNILFHTREENNPWFEYDLGKPTRFSSMTIRNRSDYGPDRAVPLVVEISNDRDSYKEIARKETTFDVWKPRFEPRVARYVRVRVARTSFLHLESVAVHP
jgi:F5/8 type C domain